MAFLLLSFGLLDNCGSISIAMSSLSAHYRWFATVCLLIGVFLAGCGNPEPEIPKADFDHLGKILDAYYDATNKLGHPPKSMDDLRSFLERQGDVNTLLKSPSDGENYVIIWNVDFKQPFDTYPPVIAYEKVGLNGKRKVLTTMAMALVSDEEFAKYKVPKKPS